jgi:hypothetical protein
MALEAGTALIVGVGLLALAAVLALVMLGCVLYAGIRCLRGRCPR